MHSHTKLFFRACCTISFHTHTPTHMHGSRKCLPPSHTHSLSLSHTHTHTHTLSLSLSLSPNRGSDGITSPFCRAFLTTSCASLADLNLLPLCWFILALGATPSTARKITLRGLIIRNRAWETQNCRDTIGEDVHFMAHSDFSRHLRNKKLRNVKKRNATSVSCLGSMYVSQVHEVTPRPKQLLSCSRQKCEPYI